MVSSLKDYTNSFRTKDVCRVTADWRLNMVKSLNWNRKCKSIIDRATALRASELSHIALRRIQAKKRNPQTYHQVGSLCEKQTWGNLIIVDHLRVVETTCIKLVDKKSWQSTCIKPVDNLQQTCYHQAGASDANESWYRLDDSKTIW